MKTARRSTPVGCLVVALIVSVVGLAQVAVHAQPIFTGDVGADFPQGAGNGVVTFVDPGGVGDAAPTKAMRAKGCVPGTDMVDARFYYDAATDTLYVGLNTYGIAGDADGDGRPGDLTYADCGEDTTDFGGSECFALMLDTNADGKYEVIAGVSSVTDIGGFTVAAFIGQSNPPNTTVSFGLPLTKSQTGESCDFVGTRPASPSPTRPDLEFSIVNYSKLPGVPPGTPVDVSYVFTAFIGSLTDNVGEDFIYGTSAIGDTVWGDQDGNGKQSTGELGIKGVTIALIRDLDSDGVVNGQDYLEATATTGSSGRYYFNGLPPGGYLVRVTDDYDVLGSSMWQTNGSTGQHSVSLGLASRYLLADFGYAGAIYYPPSLPSLSGYVYCDANNDGVLQATEAGIGGVSIALTGIDALGGAVSRSAVTAADGWYLFANLPPGCYTIVETQPVGYHDGIDTIGTQGGSSANDVFSDVVLGAGVLGTDYNFGELPPSGVSCGDTATIGYWQNKNGQNLIKSLNGGPNSTALGTWLATSFPNIWGGLADKTNTKVAACYVTLFKAKGMKLEAQALAVALAVYVTDMDLAGPAASEYGFTVTASGTGAKTYNVGSSGAAFGVANNTVLTVMEILQGANAQAVNGVLYGDNPSLSSPANTVLTGINETGDIL